MIEPMMYVAVGLLLGGLVGLAIIPLIHRRTERLTKRRLVAALPQSIGKIQAYKDGLRADFAVAVRRLEIRNEQLLDRLATQMVMLSKKDEAIKVLWAHIEATTIDSPSIQFELPKDGHSIAKSTWRRSLVRAS
jgi:hypothetical protein